MSKQIEHVQFVSTLSKGQNVTINSFDVVAVFDNKVECCFDDVVGVDRALHLLAIHLRGQLSVCFYFYSAVCTSFVLLYDNNNNNNNNNISHISSVHFKLYTKRGCC